ncbi:uncharacterized protein METZ01_LOCUS275367 [marine metagenome]|uniref:Uncharacterized protein n=1 Tax=marine metagenome TaxID=408172 RepID=A0A382KGH5_9ZZZZ
MLAFTDDYDLMRYSRPLLLAKGDLYGSL